jgi:hypothetical protein
MVQLIKPIQLIIFLFLAAALYSCGDVKSKEQEQDRPGITINKTNPFYWNYNGKQTLLLGGTVDDNLYQIDNLEEHLDLLASVGGNYVRNVMSCRDSGNVWPFRQLENGMYDLRHYDDEHWRRFENFLAETAKRDIIVQIEVWATFDFYRDVWDVNPFNPKNNVNYDSRRSKLPEVVETHPTFTENNFFRSVPSQMSLARVLEFQQRFVDKMLSYSLEYDHVLYCMDNETSVTSDWGKYWATYIRKKANLMGKEVYTTEMWDPHDLNHPFHAETFDNPDIFNFIDISQNTHQSSDNQWNNGITQLERLKAMDFVRPVNNVKVYGNDGGPHKTTRDAIENFIKNSLMGCAATRFHRPPTGQGLNEIAQAVIKSMRQLSDMMDFFEGMPHNDLLKSREPGEAYCRAIPNLEYAVYFPDGGEAVLDLTQFKGSPQLVWLNVLSSEWTRHDSPDKKEFSLKAPGKGHWIALIGKDISLENVTAVK